MKDNGFFKTRIMPSLVLCLICAVVCVLLVGAYELTYVDNTGVMTDELADGCQSIFGDREYSIVKSDDGSPLQLSGVTSVITDADKSVCVLEVTEDGYNKDGIHILVGIDGNGAVAGVSYISCGETPGLGTKTDDADYLAGYKGAASEDEVNAVDNVTGASYSSRGIKSAVSSALKAYSENKEAIFGE